MILGVDPGGDGGHTGVVLIGVPEDGPAFLSDSWAVSDDVTGFVDWYQTNGCFLMIDTVVCEHFVNRNIAGADLTPCFVEGAVRALFRDTETVLSPASGKNSAVSDDVLKRLGMYAFPGDHHHDRREAARHAIRYLKKQRHVPTLRAGWG